MGSALRGAASRAGQILPWAIVSATVSLILRAIQERGGILARIAAGFAGMAWSLVTFLVLPILVIEGLSVGAAIKRSSQLFRKAWGEQVIANAGIGLVGVVAVIAGLPLLLLAGTGIAVLQVIGIGAFAVWVGLVVCVTSALSGVFQTALYHYAANGMPPAAFAPADPRARLRPQALPPLARLRWPPSVGMHGSGAGGGVDEEGSWLAVRAGAVGGARVLGDRVGRGTRGRARRHSRRIRHR